LHLARAKDALKKGAGKPKAKAGTVKGKPKAKTGTKGPKAETGNAGKPSQMEAGKSKASKLNEKNLEEVGTMTLKEKLQKLAVEGKDPLMDLTPDERRQAFGYLKTAMNKASGEEVKKAWAALEDQGARTGKVVHGSVQAYLSTRLIEPLERRTKPHLKCLLSSDVFRALKCERRQRQEMTNKQGCSGREAEIPQGLVGRP